MPSLALVLRAAEPHIHVPALRRAGHPRRPREARGPRAHEAPAAEHPVRVAAAVARVGAVRARRPLPYVAGHIVVAKAGVPRREAAHRREGRLPVALVEQGALLLFLREPLVEIGALAAARVDELGARL